MELGSTEDVLLNRVDTWWEMLARLQSCLIWIKALTPQDIPHLKTLQRPQTDCIWWKNEIRPTKWNCWFFKLKLSLCKEFSIEKALSEIFGWNKKKPNNFLQGSFRQDWISIAPLSNKHFKIDQNFVLFCEKCNSWGCSQADICKLNSPFTPAPTHRIIAGKLYFFDWKWSAQKQWPIN